MEQKINSAGAENDPRLFTSVWNFLKVLNTGKGKPIEQLSFADARKVLTDAQNSITVNIYSQKISFMITLIKQFISVVLITATIVFSVPQNAASQSTFQGLKNIVLVHGAFADGSCWSKVIPSLQAKGYNVVAVQNPLTSLANDVTAARRAIAQMDGPVLLVAHSYGGMVISEAGNDPKVAGLLYVAALVPEDGQTANQVNAMMPTTGIEKEFVVSADGFVTLSLQTVNDRFAPDASLEERRLIHATQVPLAASAGEEKVISAAWKSKPSWFIVAAQDKVISPDLERFKSKLIKATTIELNSSHVPMISQPKKVTDFIVSAARKL
jgi:pimeloyl-ACP methyl ester carboxylesterase